MRVRSVGLLLVAVVGCESLRPAPQHPPPNPSPIPEPSTFAVMLACGAAGLLYHHRNRIDVADLRADD